MKYKWLLAAALVVAISLVALVGLAQKDAAMAAQDSTAKIEAGLLDSFATNGSADFIVMMAEQADVSAADQLQTKLEKGQYVFDTLVATASRSQADLRSYLDAQGADFTSFYIVNAIWVKAGTLDLAQNIAGRADVAAINANHTYQLAEPINLQMTSAQPAGVEPNISFINAPEAWAMGVTGEGTVVAGNDTGLTWSHPAIAPHYRGCLNPPTCDQVDHNYNWYDVFAPSNRVPWDDYGHGTHTTGTMVGDDGAGNQIGVAPGAKTIHCKNMQSGSGDDAHFIECFEWDLAPWDLNGANPRPDLAPDSINNSWGMPGGGDNNMRTAVDNLLAAGIIVEVSAGNEGSGCSSLRSPGDYLETFTTGSVNHAAAFPGTITGFSSRGPSALDGNYFPDFMAPGENVRSVWDNDYGYASGTSMAGPHTAALIGLIWSANPALRGQVDLTYQIIQDTVTPLTGQNGSNCGGDYTVGPNNDWGYGTIDALAAVQAAIAMGGAGQLDGTVTDAGTHLPIQDVTIHAVSQGGFAREDLTDGTGYFTMTLAADTYTVSAHKYGYADQVVGGVEVVTDTLTTQNFELTAVPTHVVSGYVTDADSGAPVAATVEFTDAGVPVPPVNTDPGTGFYSISVAEGTWHLKASALSYTSQTFEVVVTSDITQDFQLTYQETWTQISPLPNGCPDWTRLDAEYYVGTGLAYILGGRGGSDGGSTYGDVYSYDPVANTCADTGVNMPTPVSNYTIGLVNDGSADLLCIFGGRDSAGGYTANYQCYDPNANTAFTVGTLPGELPGFIPGGVVVVNNKAYVFAGFRNTTTPYHTAQTWEWDPVANTWTQKGNVTIGRGYIDVAVVDGLIYGFGGDVFDGTNLNAQTIAEVFDPTTGIWDDAAVTDLPVATGEGRAFGFDIASGYNLAGMIVVAGGGQWPGVSAEAFSYNIAEDSYDYTFPDLIEAYRNAAGFFVPGNPVGAMYTFGGRAAADTPPYALPEFYPVRVTIPQANIKVTWPSLDVVLSPDTQTTQTIKVQNIGTLPLDWSLFEVTPAGWLAETPTSGTLDPGDPAIDVVVTFDATGLTPGVFNTTLQIDSNDPDSPSVSKAVVLTVKPLADLSIVKTDTPDPVYDGHPLTYTLAVSNLGPMDATGVVVTDNLPAGVTFGHASPGCQAVGLVVTCTVGDLAADGTVSLEIVVTSPSTAGTINNTAVIGSDEVVDPDDTNNVSTVETTVEIEPADLAIMVEDAPDPVRFGEVFTYTIVVSNLGTNDATTVKVVDNLPSGVSYVRATPGCGRVGLKVTCNIGALAAGDSVELFITVRAPSLETTLTNTATVSGHEPDPDMINNTATTQTLVVAPISDIYLPLVTK